jgi:hypothetical protein
MMTEQDVAELVNQAFRGVRLGNGVGLQQGKGLDEYADEATLRELRSNDEATDWSRIPLKHLNRYLSSLSFMDEEGMRFHLPAFLLADLRDELSTGDVLFYLCYSHGSDADHFKLLSNEQRNAVRQFVLLRLADPHYEFQKPTIEKSLDRYWKSA